MIKLNGKKFAANKKELQAYPDCVGFYRVNRRSVSIQNLNKEKVGVITYHGVLASAKKLEGEWWYSHAAVELVGEYDSYTRESTEVHAILKRFNIKKISR